MKKLLSVTLIVFYSFSFLSAQIFFQNPSFEGDANCIGFTVPEGWTVCDDHVGLLSDTQSAVCQPPWFPRKSISGAVFVELDSRKPNVRGTLAQGLICEFSPNKEYAFYVFAASLWGPPDSLWAQGIIPGNLSVFLGWDSCDKRQTIFRSTNLDSSWRRLEVVFTADTNYNWISFSPNRDSIDYVAVVLLDTISPIYLINANAVHVANKDTVVYTQPNEQKCITVKATSTISTYDTVQWYKLVDTVKVPVALGLQASVCVDSNTTFLIGLRDSVMGCAGVEWSWDTLRVWVRDTVLGVREVDAVDAFSLQPNPVVDVLTITPSFDGPYDWTITDALGRLSAKGRGRNTTSVPLEGLSRGAYLLQVEGVVRRFLKE
ncbi:MAG: T9SS type A sorting domain-containing protein [Chitinophagales bacterium]